MYVISAIMCAFLFLNHCLLNGAHECANRPKNIVSLRFMETMMYSEPSIKCGQKCRAISFLTSQVNLMKIWLGIGHTWQGTLVIISTVVSVHSFIRIRHLRHMHVPIGNTNTIPTSKSSLHHDCMSLMSIVQR